MRFVAAALLGCVSASQFSELDVKFMQHIVKFNLSFDDIAEFNSRKSNFANIDYLVEEVNNGDYTWKAAHNKFSTWTEEEKQKRYGLRDRTPIKQANPDARPPIFDTPNQTFPTSVDWRTMGCVSPIQDQGNCGSCWAFSATSGIESANCVAKGNTGLTKLSEQQVVDCCGSRYQCAGCNGGW